MVAPTRSAPDRSAAIRTASQATETASRQPLSAVARCAVSSSRGGARLPRVCAAWQFFCARGTRNMAI